MTNPAIGLDEMLGSDWRSEVDRRTAEIGTRVGARTDVVLFGTGYLGKHVLADLRGLPYNAAAFVDNNPALWGTEVQGVEVLSPDHAKSRFGDTALWLITIYTNSRVIEQCRALGVPWVTCAELSWLLPEPHPSSFEFDTPDHLAESAAEIETASSIWSDAASEAEYRSQVRWRFLLDYQALATPRPMLELYFPKDLIRALDREVFVDCGAFTGDTIEAFLTAHEGRFAEIVGIEPDAGSARVLQGRVDEWKRSGIEPMRVESAAVGSERGTLTFDKTGTAGSKVGTGTETVEVATLDELLADSPPTYIKFDVEGAEHDALVGGSETIKANMPVLAVCLYHRPEDLWDVPLLVRSLRPDYKLYVRRYSDERWETVLYAVPPDRVLI
jgi:FkbM family methyltransferase